jgi:hypothetical protein
VVPGTQSGSYRPATPEEAKAAEESEAKAKADEKAKRQAKRAAKKAANGGGSKFDSFAKKASFVHGMAAAALKATGHEIETEKVDVEGTAVDVVKSVGGLPVEVVVLRAKHEKGVKDRALVKITCGGKTRCVPEGKANGINLNRVLDAVESVLEAGKGEAEKLAQLKKFEADLKAMAEARGIDLLATDSAVRVVPTTLGFEVTRFVSSLERVEEVLDQLGYAKQG